MGKLQRPLMLPGKYDASVVSIVIVALALGFGFALASGKQLVAAANPVAAKVHRIVFSTMPMIVWFVVVLAFGGLPNAADRCSQMMYGNLIGRPRC